MKKTSLLAVSIVSVASTIGAMTYFDSNIHHENFTSESKASVEQALSELRTQINDLTMTQDQVNQAYETKSDNQNKLDKLIASLDQRLLSIEQKLVDLEDVAGETEAYPDYEPDNLNDEQKISDNSVGEWVANTLAPDTGQLDLEKTEEIESQIVEGLSSVPNMNLDDLKCASTGFCMATFSQYDGGTASLDGLYGVPPFVNELSISVDDENRLQVLFTDAATSLKDLRNYAANDGY